MKKFLSAVAIAILAAITLAFPQAGKFEQMIKSHIDRYVTESLKSDTLGTTLPVAGMTYSLSGAGVSNSASSVILQSLTIPQSGQKIITGDLSTTFYLTLEPGNRTRQEIIGCTAVTQNVGGTATLSGCSRGLSPISPFAASTTLAFNHAGGTSVIFSDPPQLFNQYAAKQNTQYVSGAWIASSTNPLSYDLVFGITSSSTSTVIPYVSWVFNNFVDKYNAQTVDGVKTFSAKPIFSVVPTSAQAPSVGSDVANKTYVDGVSVAGASNADTSTKGIVEEATVSEINAATAAGATGAQLFVNPSFFEVSKFASTTASTTQIATAATAATTTHMFPGQTALVIVTFCSQNSNSEALFAKPVGQATSTLSLAIQNSSGGDVAHTTQGTFTSTIDANVKFYLATDINNTFAPGCTGGSTWTILKFATSTFAN